ncbi:MAG: 3-oxoacyl-(acyl-carrier-protein) synthase 2 [Bacteroidetes bacterium]|nr:3-oxoacyl-(acyl-carrier-protein) synthase 2 [Bacteroidota bacterium]
MNGNRRVVVTGVGALTPIGLGVDEFWKNLVAGKSGAGPVTYFDASGYDTHFACELKGFNPTAYLDRKAAQRMDPFAQYANISADLAIADAKLSSKDMDGDRIGVVYGSGIGGMKTYDTQFNNYIQGGPGRISPFFIPMLIPDIASGQISIKHGFKGPNYATVSACATGSHAIGDACRLIQYGDADVIVCGGAEAPITPMGLGGFNSMKALSTRNDAPEKASRPFDLNRDGFVMGEGGGTLVLEELESARKRGVHIYCELVGVGFTADAHHMTAPPEGGEGAVRSMRRALADAGITPELVDYVNVHGTSTPLGDISETRAIKTTFGDHARKLSISSTKSMTGHLLGAAGAVEAIVAILSIVHGIIPPTINYETPDPECDLNCTPNSAVKRPVQYAMSNTFGFGGHNATLLMRKFTGD